MKKEIKKGSHGGYRPGSGRRPVTEERKAVSFRCPISLKEDIDAAAKKEKESSPAAWVRKACIFYLGKEITDYFPQKNSCKKSKT